ncbi:hypothetical protein RFI_09620 [Reticulomyxa filosa]|uniref:Uncharacterized protein n=1 Tax=Reticulomyxa filosa TaxID=46433 RepID=X6NMM6_RETFI|nr:hypothetical protein RFI_09620 [Reticulomyxa filosa]|eukprot:ETO27510.1 hypothetical protein RFI_09620 [Reticulomyxa filosa]
MTTTIKGQDEFVTMKSEWFREGEGFIIVYSITTEESLVKDAVGFRNEILNEKGTNSVPMFTYAAPDFLVLAGNKCDLSDQREVPTEKGQQMAKQWLVMKKRFFYALCRDCPFYECSAKEKINLEAVFEQCVREIRKSLNHNDNNELTITEKKSCCVVL